MIKKERESEREKAPFLDEMLRFCVLCIHVTINEHKVSFHLSSFLASPSTIHDTANRPFFQPFRKPSHSLLPLCLLFEFVL